MLLTELASLKAEVDEQGRLYLAFFASSAAIDARSNFIFSETLSSITLSESFIFFCRMRSSSSLLEKSDSFSANLVSYSLRVA